MALILADRVKETTTSTGTGPVTLLGAVTGFQSFSVIGDTNTTYYTIVGRTTSEWEVGIGTYAATGTTLARTQVLSSSNSNAAVSFSAGTKDVFVTYPASRSINLDSTGTLAQAVTTGLGTGRLPVEQYYGLNTAYAGTNATGAQSILGFGVAVPNTALVYQFEGNFCFLKTAGTTAHTMSIGFGGTASVGNIGYSFVEEDISGTVNARFASGLGCGFVNTVTPVVVTASMSSATEFVSVLVRGQMSVSVSGSFIPQYTLSAAPGGAYTTQIGSYFKLSPLAASGSNVNIGTWV